MNTTLAEAIEQIKNGTAFVTVTSGPLMGDDEATQIALVLPQNRTGSLLTLTLNGRQMTSVGARKLIAAASSRKSGIFLDLSHNPFGDVGLQVLTTVTYYTGGLGIVGLKVRNCSLTLASGVLNTNAALRGLHEFDFADNPISANGGSSFVGNISVQMPYLRVLVTGEMPTAALLSGLQTTKTSLGKIVATEQLAIGDRQYESFLAANEKLVSFSTTAGFATAFLSAGMLNNTNIISIDVPGSSSTDLGSAKMRAQTNYQIIEDAYLEFEATGQTTQFEALMARNAISPFGNNLNDGLGDTMLMRIVRRPGVTLAFVNKVVAYANARGVPTIYENLANRQGQTALSYATQANRQDIFNALQAGLPLTTLGPRATLTDLVGEPTVFTSTTALTSSEPSTSTAFITSTTTSNSPTFFSGITSSNSPTFFSNNASSNSPTFFSNNASSNSPTFFSSNATRQLPGSSEPTFSMASDRLPVVSNSNMDGMAANLLIPVIAAGVGGFVAVMCVVLLRFFVLRSRRRQEKPANEEGSRSGRPSNEYGVVPGAVASGPYTPAPAAKRDGQADYSLLELSDPNAGYDNLPAHAAGPDAAAKKAALGSQYDSPHSPMDDHAADSYSRIPGAPQHCETITQPLNGQLAEQYSRVPGAPEQHVTGTLTMGR